MTLYLHYWTLISFSLLIITSPFWSMMPDWHYILVCAVCLMISIKYRQARLVVGLALACVVILVHGNLLRYQTETLFQAGENISITAEVDSIFQPTNHGFHGIVLVRSINGYDLNSLYQPKIRLKIAHHLQLGDLLEARVKLSPITGLMNGVGFDAEKYAFSQGIVGEARVASNQSYFVVNRSSNRGLVVERVSNAIDSFPHSPLFKALLFGDRSELASETWAKLQHSGLSHLVSISGLHIGIVFGLGWWLGLVLLRFHPRLSKSCVVVGLGLAFGYAWLAGFSIPTQRAFLMCALLCLIQLRAGELGYFYKWLLVLSGLLALDPFSVASSSLWMSMFAVGLVFIFLSLRINVQGSWWLKACRLQLFIVLAMSPLVAYLFNGVSLSAVLYNLIFVPWFSVIVVPLLFIAFAYELLLSDAGLIWQAVDLSLSVVTWAMNYAHWGWVDVSNGQLKWLAVSLVLLVLYPVLTNQSCAVFALIAILSFSNWRSQPLWQLVVLDVGHGLAVIVNQDEHSLLYDTGAAWNESSIAERVIFPFMSWQGRRNIDYLVLSHLDNDHAGGWQKIVERFAPTKVLTSQKDIGNTLCVQGQSWQWHEIEIQVMWPPNVASRAYNPHSCVIKLTHIVEKSSVLLTGDIESIAEWMLIRQGPVLEADVILVPHHGSATSSLPLFIDVVKPDLAIASTAKSGRWSLPNKDVVERYQERGARWLDTGSSGQVVVDFYPENTHIRTLRDGKGGSWYRQMLRKGVE